MYAKISWCRGLAMWLFIVVLILRAVGSFAHVPALGTVTAVAGVVAITLLATYTILRSRVTRRVFETLAATAEHRRSERLVREYQRYLQVVE
ncbi:hypothetical protein [Microbacterium kribbense]|uniref:hypothetical protein n=1 Tax=Microbacterium kribbense TaxID=433645 RepID=UPI0031E02757